RLSLTALHPIVTGYKVRKPALPAVEAKPVGGTCLKCVNTAKCGLAVVARFQRNPENRILGDCDGFDAYRATSKIGRKIWCGRFGKINGPNALRRQQIKWNRGLIGLGARHGRAIEERVRVPFTKAAHIDELAVNDGNTDHSLCGASCIACGSLGD